jgi:putative Ig domain-containing protein
VTTNTLPAGTINFADASIASFFDKTSGQGWANRTGDILQFPPSSSCELICDNHKNLINRGILRSRPANASIVHKITFKNIDESLFVTSQKKGCTSATAVGTTLTYAVNPNSFPGVVSHNFVVGDSFAASGFSAGYNGTFVITARTQGTISCVTASAPPSSTSAVLGAIRASGIQTPDTGIWVVGAGTLDIEGTNKLTWTRAAATIASGAQTVTCEDTLTGWQAGDLVRIAPTGRNQHADHIGTMTIQSVSGNQVTFTAGVPRIYERVTVRPAVTVYGVSFPALQFGPELVNLTQNVQWRGEEGSGAAGDPTHGRLHTIITAPSGPRLHHVKNLELIGIGPIGVGRWAWHLHHEAGQSAGSVFENIIARNGGDKSHSFVQHASDGTIFRRCVAYNVDGSPFWWDHEDLSDFPATAGWEYCGVLNVKDRLNTDTRIHGFELVSAAIDRGATVKGCWAACVVHTGSALQSSGFGWPEIRPTGGEVGAGRGWNWAGSAVVDFNVAHNCRHGLFGWQNTQGFEIHTLPNVVVYRCFESGIDMGAYGNSSRIEPFIVYDCGTMGSLGRISGVIGQSVNKNGADGKEGKNQYGYVDMAGLSGVPALRVVETNNAGDWRVWDTDFVNVSANKPIWIEIRKQGGHGSDFKRLELNRCRIQKVGEAIRDILPTDLDHQVATPGCRIRVQSRDDLDAFEITYPISVATANPPTTYNPDLAPYAFRVTTQQADIPLVTVGVAYSFQLTASQTGTWTTFAGSAMPSGFALSATGLLTNPNPTTQGTFAFTPEAENTDGFKAPKQLSVTVQSAPPTGLQFVTTSPLPDATELKNYAPPALQLTGGTGPFTFALDDPANYPLPPGVTLLSSGSFAGAPNENSVGTTPQTYRIKVRGRDSLNATVDKFFDILVIPKLQITTTILPDATVGTVYDETLGANFGTGSRTWSLASGTLPPGMTLTATTGRIFGNNPTTANTYNFTARVTDSLGDTATQALSIIVAPELVIESFASPFLAYVGTPFSKVVNLAGGNEPFSWLLVDAPAWMKLTHADPDDRFVTLSGTPTSGSGSFSVVVSVGDSVGAVDQGNYTVSVGVAHRPKGVGKLRGLGGVVVPAAQVPSLSSGLLALTFATQRVGHVGLPLLLNNVGPVGGGVGVGVIAARGVGKLTVLASVAKSANLRSAAKSSIIGAAIVDTSAAVRGRGRICWDQSLVTSFGGAKIRGRGRATVAAQGFLTSPASVRGRGKVSVAAIGIARGVANVRGRGLLSSAFVGLSAGSATLRSASELQATGFGAVASSAAIQATAHVSVASEVIAITAHQGLPLLLASGALATVGSSAKGAGTITVGATVRVAVVPVTLVGAVKVSVTVTVGASITLRGAGRTSAAGLGVGIGATAIKGAARPSIFGARGEFGTARLKATSLLIPAVTAIAFVSPASLRGSGKTSATAVGGLVASGTAVGAGHLECAGGEVSASASARLDATGGLVASGAESKEASATLIGTHHTLVETTITILVGEAALRGRSLLTGLGERASGVEFIDESIEGTGGDLRSLPGRSRLPTSGRSLPRR